jgi:hypothetical protein
MALSSLWQRFQPYFFVNRELGFALDISRMKFPENLFEKMRPQIENAFAAMRDLEAGVIANPTENRMVGHYWLRNSALATTPEIRSEIEETIRRIKALRKARWLISMRTISLASKRARRRPADCCSSRSECARSFLEKLKLPKRSRAQSMPTRRRRFTCCGTWRARFPDQSRVWRGKCGGPVFTRKSAVIEPL